MVPMLRFNYLELFQVQLPKGLRWSSHHGLIKSMTRMGNQLTSPRLGCDGPKSCYGSWHNAVLFAPSDMLVDVMDAAKVVDFVHSEWVDMLSEKLVGIAVYGDRSDRQEMTWSTLISSQGICKCYGAFEDPKASGGRKHESRQHAVPGVPPFAAACPDSLFFWGLVEPCGWYVHSWPAAIPSGYLDFFYFPLWWRELVLELDLTAGFLLCLQTMHRKELVRLVLRHCRLAREMFSSFWRLGAVLRFCEGRTKQVL